MDIWKELQDEGVDAGLLEESRCNASCYIDLCNYFLDAIS